VGEVVNRILRYEVPVDDRWHTIRCSPVLYVACRQVDTVEFWAHSMEEGLAPERKFRVFGTGQPLEDKITYVGTAIAPGGSLVWHLMAKW
jgi:hypothetical protein